jgi:hypothetical protein
VIRKIESEPTVESMCRLSFASTRIAATLVRRTTLAEIEGRHCIALSLDEALAIATDAYETERLATWTWEQLRKGKP